MSIGLTHGAISRIYNNVTGEKPYVQLLEIKRIGTQVGNNVERFRLVVSDGQHYQQAMLATQLNCLVNENKIRDSCIVQLEEYLCNVISNRKIIIILKLSVISDGNGSTIGSPQNIDNAAGSAIAAKPVAGAPIQTRPTPTPTPSYQPPSSRGATMMTDTPTHFNPIATLNPYQNKWTIKARVTNKSDIRTWHNEKSNGKLFSVDLLDGSGGQIKATMFNNACDKWFPMFQQDQVYVISKGTLKLANKKFNRIPNEYELTLGEDAEIQLFGEDDSIQQQKFDFRRIIDIQSVGTDAHIDVMGIVTSFSELSNITAKSSGKQLLKRTLNLVDQSETQVELTLWGDQAQKYNEHELAGNPVIVVKACRVGDFQGRNLSASFQSQIYVNPPYPEAQLLRDWWNTQGSLSSQTFGSISGQKGMGGGGAARNDERIVFSDIVDKRKGMGEAPDYFSVRGTVTFYRHADDRVPWYPACPNEKCKGKKMTGDQQSGYYCALCSTNQQPALRYILSLLVCDATGAQWLTAFNETAEKLLGIKAGDLCRLKEENPPAYEQIFLDANFKPYIFKLRAKQEPQQDENRVRCHILDVQPVNFVAETQALLEQIKLYE